MTSNVGSKAAVRRPVQVGYHHGLKTGRPRPRRPQSEYRKALEQTFTPEFLNRIDDIVLFRALDDRRRERIVDLELQGLLRRAPTGLGYKHAHYRRSPAPSGLDGLRSPLRRTGPQTHAGRTRSRSPYRP